MSLGSVYALESRDKTDEVSRGNVTTVSQRIITQLSSFPLLCYSNPCFRYLLCSEAMSECPPSSMSTFPATYTFATYLRVRQSCHISEDESLSLYRKKPSFAANSIET